MGIAELWKIIEERETQTVTTLEDEAAAAKEEHNAQGTGQFCPMVIGVDTPVIMSQCTAGTYGANQFNGMVPLEIFLYKLCRLSQTWSNVVFVFDGPNRPSTKRGHQIPVDDEPDWYGPCQKLIKEFGFHVHMAPGEAEAELAALNERGMVDVILTGDCDAFVFGANTTVKHSPSPTRNPDELGLFKTSSLLAKEPTAFSRGGLLLMALLLGGDYTEGVRGCGVVTAYGLAKCGFGETLYEACHNLDGNSRRHFIVTWLKEMCNELRTNSRGHLEQRNYVTANYLCEGTFPSNEIIDLYAHPITSFSPGQGGVNSAGWTPSEPDIPSIARTAFEHLGSNFRKHEEIVKRFHSNVWPGALKRMLLSPSQLFYPDEQLLQTSSSASMVTEVKEAARRTQRQSTVTRWFRVSFSTQHLSASLQKALNTLETKPTKKKQKVDLSTIAIWVPAAFLSPLIQAMKKRRTVPKHLRANKATEDKSDRTLDARATGVKTASLLDILDSELSHEAPKPAAESSAMGAAASHQRAPLPFPLLDNNTQTPAAPLVRRNLGFVDLTVEIDDGSKTNDTPTAAAPPVHRNLGFLDLTTDNEKIDVIYISD
ncbi:hypothetical protein D9619_002515 [Psilocybe cf. subviscida]|uniref:XPG-I domain-containing protein n=1 Tax=Psilocybe cf. subviscida TaxID=2480587 RepID=A0A8H5AW29_9AGAR|nr:hypothetical protein D9619_002515 [Psilocybe cf. subviscida]